MVFQGYLKKVLRVFTVSFKGVSRKFTGCFKEVLGHRPTTFILLQIG